MKGQSMAANLLRRIERLERLRPIMPDDGTFIITHDEFLTLMLAEIALRRPEVDNINGVGVPAPDIEGADRISAVRHHPKRIAMGRHASPQTRTAWTDHVSDVAAAMKPRILLLKEAFESGDRTAYHRKRKKDRKALLERARTIVDRVEAIIGPQPQTAG